MASIMCRVPAMTSTHVLRPPPMATAFVSSQKLATRVSASPIIQRRRWSRIMAVAGGEAEAGPATPAFDITRLEQYTEKVKSEVLRVHAVVDGEEDQVVIFKGFSSSLMRPTAFDPAEPVLPPSATIRAIDRIRGPYNPAKVLLIKGGRGLSWEQFQAFLEDKGL